MVDGHPHSVVQAIATYDSVFVGNVEVNAGVRVTRSVLLNCYYAGNASFNTTLKYTVEQLVGGWQGYVDGVAKGPVLNWLSSAYAIEAGGEVGSSGVSITGRFGYPDLVWQAFDGGAWVNASGPFTSDSSGWTVGGSFPSNWTVTHS